MDCLLLPASRDCSTSPQNRTSSPPLASPSCNLSLPVRLCAATRSSPAEMDGSSLKSAQLLEQMRLHMATDAGKELTKKVGLVYQLNIAPKKLGVDEEIFVVDLKKGEDRTRGSRMLPSPSLTTISLESPAARRTRRLRSSAELLRSRGA
uniref:Uncharacterized protein n=1 Tax=Setaria italica TaxID=4555 RepID=K3XZS3_SETIT